VVVEKLPQSINNSENHSEERMKLYIKEKSQEFARLSDEEFSKSKKEFESACGYTEAFIHGQAKDEQSGFNLIGKTRAVFMVWGSILKEAEEIRKNKNA
jgi:hypothetical protein